MKPLKPLPAAFLALLAGILAWLAFPGMDCWPLAFLWWTPLLLAIRGQRPLRALWLGWVMGTVGNLLGFYWLLNMLREFSGFPMAACGFIFFLMCAYQGGRFAFMTFLVARAERNGWPFGPAVLAAFVAHELVYPLLFPWYMGATVHQVPVLMQLADVGGVIAVGLALLGGSLAAAELFWRPVSWRRVALALIGPALLLGYGVVRLPQVDRAIAAAPPATIGMVQGNLALADREVRDSGAVHRVATDILERGPKLDLVVWAENSLKFVIPDATLGPVLWQRVLQGVVNTPVLAGCTVQRGTDIYNTAVLVHPDGRVEGVYDKTYLLAFGEYIPFGDLFPQLYEISRNSGRFRAGTRLDPIPFGEHRITVLICYEDILPGFTNRLVRHANPDLLVNMTNDAWFGPTTEPYIHLALAKFRSVEHRRFMVRVTNTGISAFIDPNGRTWGETPLFQEAGRVGEVRWMRSRTLYELWGDIPWWIATLAVVAMGIWRRRPAVRGIEA